MFSDHFLTEGLMLNDLDCIILPVELACIDSAVAVRSLDCQLLRFDPYLYHLIYRKVTPGS